MRLYLIALIAAIILFGSLSAKRSTELMVIQRGEYTLEIDPYDLRIGIKTQSSIIPPHHLGSISFSRESDNQVYPLTKFEITKRTDTLLKGRGTNSIGQTADIELSFSEKHFSIEVKPNFGSTSPEDVFTIDFRTTSLSPAYGLGDHGGYGSNIDVTGFIDEDFGNRNNEHRFISNFSIFPAHELAQVLFEEKTKRVVINEEENRLGATGVKKAKIYYLIGSPKETYKQFKAIKLIEGYPDLKPKYRFFQLGYEAFGSLGWNTYQTSVQDDIQNYLERKFPIKWAVVGSGFWKGERGNPTEGSTTSFGIWDDTAETIRNDNLPNPRYPQVQEFKNFFASHDISLLLGLRINFKSPVDYGGNYNTINDGAAPVVGLKRQFYVKNKQGEPEVFRVNFPQGNVFLLNTKNTEAVEWYNHEVEKWGVDGFKEDLMLQDGKKLNNDSKLNPVNEGLMSKGYHIMARNGAYSVPGDILRLEDTKYGFDQDRPIINALNYAASGASAVYIDIVAGKYLKNPLTEDQKLYFVRNAMLAAVSPIMAMGHGPWHLKNEEYERAVKKAVDWHHEYSAYIYSEALKSHYTGYPYTMTPLPIAYPNDPFTFRIAGKEKRQYTWMLGESILSTPLYGNDYATANHRDVYLPEGKWIDYETKELFEGPLTLSNYHFPLNKIPAFIGGKGLLVKQVQEDFHLELYPVADHDFHYTFYYPDGISNSVIHKDFSEWKLGEYMIINQTTGEKNSLKLTEVNAKLQFLIQPNHNYTIYEKAR